MLELEQGLMRFKMRSVLLNLSFCTRQGRSLFEGEQLHFVSCVSISRIWGSGRAK
jgi:hypothetical protein